MDKQLQDLTKEIFLAMVQGNPGAILRVDLTYDSAHKAAQEYIRLEKKKLS